MSESAVSRPVTLPDTVPRGRGTRHVALVSGGLDSTVAAAVAAEHVPKLDVLVHLDTGIGLEDNHAYLKELADALGYQLWTLRTQVRFDERVRANGFPGPSRHGIMYRSLKERQIAKLATMTADAELVLWSGVRRSESERRSRTVEPVMTDERWTWVAPLHDWDRSDCLAYIESHDLPENPLWYTLGRSGDCFCGCFATREELLDLEVAGCADRAEWLRELEQDVVDVYGKKGRWAWGSMDKSDHALAEIDDGLQRTLCSDCFPKAPDENGGGDGE